MADPAEPSPSSLRRMLYWGDSTGQRPQDHVRDIPDAVREAAVFILKNGRDAHPGMRLKGWADCRICGAQLGSGNLTAFGFVWPEKAEHYILAHRVWTPECAQLLQQVLDGPRPPQQTQLGAATPPRTRVTLASLYGDQVVYAEFVTGDATKHGLMFRQHMPIDAGMLFDMREDRDWAFYMRNTFIPLDMIFITKDLTIAGIYANASPLTEELRSVGVASRYVLEVNGGWCATHGVATGSKVRFDPI